MVWDSLDILLDNYDGISVIEAELDIFAGEETWRVMQELNNQSLARKLNLVVYSEGGKVYAYPRG